MVPTRKYEIYHDESKEGGFHHGILLIPEDRRNNIIQCLKLIRIAHKVNKDINIKYAGCFSKKKIGHMVRSNLALFSHAIQSKCKNTPLYNITEREKHTGVFQCFHELNDSFDCRFGLLRIEDNFEGFGSKTYKEKVELTMKFLIKGCCHAMFDENHPIEIVKAYFDGDEHHGDDIDINAIFKTDFRKYIMIADKLKVDSRHIKQRKDDTLLLMNLVDNVVGGFRSILNRESDKTNILAPLKEIYQRISQNKIFANKNGRWYKSICFSELIAENGNIEFVNICRDKTQLKLL